MTGAESFCCQSPKCTLPGIHGTEIPGAALVWLFLRLVFFFNSAFSCIISISYLVLELARISYVVCKQRTITETNDHIKMVLSAVPDSSELSLLVLMWLCDDSVLLQVSLLILP